MGGGIIKQGIPPGGATGPIQIGAGPAVGQQPQGQQLSVPGLGGLPVPLQTQGLQQPSSPAFPLGERFDASQFLAQRMLSK